MNNTLKFIKDAIREELKLVKEIPQVAPSDSEVQEIANIINGFIKKMRALDDVVNREDAMTELAKLFLRTSNRLPKKHSDNLEVKIERYLDEDDKAFFDDALMSLYNDERVALKEPKSKLATYKEPNSTSKLRPIKEKPIKIGSVVFFRKKGSDDKYQSGVVSKRDDYRDGSLQLKIDSGKYIIQSKQWDITTTPQ